MECSVKSKLIIWCQCSDQGAHPRFISQYSAKCVKVREGKEKDKTSTYSFSIGAWRNGICI